MGAARSVVRNCGVSAGDLFESMILGLIVLIALVCFASCGSNNRPTLGPRPGVGESTVITPAPPTTKALVPTTIEY